MPKNSNYYFNKLEHERQQRELSLKPLPTTLSEPEVADVQEVSTLGYKLAFTLYCVLSLVAIGAIGCSALGYHVIMGIWL